MTTEDHQPLLLSGLDGSNPLAFLAALGTLRVLTKMYPQETVTLGWRMESGAWRPALNSVTLELNGEALCGSMAEWLATPPQMPLLESEQLGDNLTISPVAFRELALYMLRRHGDGKPESNTALEFLAAFGTDAAHQPHSKDRKLMQDSALRTMSGAGHQHFIKFMREIIANTSSSHLYATLFRDWTYTDEGRGMNLRWDPIDDRRYAMRWKNPSSDPATTMRGANRLAIEALPLFPTAPMGSGLQTTGFRSKRGTFWSWPIWDSQIELPVVQGLLQLAAMTRDNSVEERANMAAIGIAAIYRSQRITVGKFRNFTPAKSV